MKKLQLLVVVLLLGAAAWGGATYVVGGRVESRYFGLLEEYGQWGPLTLSNQGYERGLLGARAATLLEVVLPQPSEEPDGEPGVQRVQMLFEHEVQHGPILFGGQGTPATGLALIETRLARITPGEAQLEQLYREVPELREAIATVRVDFDGSSDSRLQVPPFATQAEAMRIDCGGLTSSVDFSPAGGTLRGEVEMPAMTLRAEDATVTWNGIRGRCEMAEALPMLYVGTSQAQFGGMDMSLPGTDGGQQVVRMKKAEIVSESRFDDGRVQVNQVTNFDGLTVDGKDYGPLIIDVDLRNLDGQALSEMQQQLQDVYRRAESFNPDRIAAELIPVYSRFLTRMMAGQPEVNVKRLYLATPQGEADGTFRIRLAEPPESPAQNPLAPLSALQNLDAALDVAVDESLVRAILLSQAEDGVRAAAGASPQASPSEEEIAAMVEAQVTGQLEAWAAQKFIVRDGAKIKTNATFRQGELTVNGETLPLAGG